MPPSDQEETERVVGVGVLWMLVEKSAKLSLGLELFSPEAVKVGEVQARRRIIGLQRKGPLIRPLGRDEITSIDLEGAELNLGLRARR